MKKIILNLAFLGYLVPPEVLKYGQYSLADNKMQWDYINSLLQANQEVDIDLAIFSSNGLSVSNFSRANFKYYNKATSFYPKIFPWSCFRKLITYSQLAYQLFLWAKANRGEGIILSYNTLNPHIMLALLVKMIFRVKVIPIAITLPYDYKVGKRGLNECINSFISRKLLFQVDGLVAITSPLARFLLPNKPSCIISGGINAKEVKRNTEMINVRSKSLNICYTGTLYDRYHIRDILKAFSNLPEHNLQIYGTGPLQEEVEYYANKYKNICYYGVIDQIKLREVQRNADILLALLDTGDNLARFSFPSKLYEYMAYGQVVVASKLETYSPKMQGVLELSETSSQAIIDIIKQIARWDLVTRTQKVLAMRNYLLNEATWEQISQRLIIFLKTL